MTSIRRSDLEDIPVIISIALQSYLNNYTFLWHDNGVGYMQLCFNNDRLAGEFADSNSAFFLIYENQEAVGYLKLNINKAIGSFSADNAIELERIYLLKKASGRGIGKKAMEFVKTYALTKNKKILWLKTMENSDALAFYKKQGFVFFGEELLTFPEMKDEFRKILTLYKEI
jgi:diamine N-acetyltransferase